VSGSRQVGGSAHQRHGRVSVGLQLANFLQDRVDRGWLEQSESLCERHRGWVGAGFGLGGRLAKREEHYRLREITGTTCEGDTSWTG
jgi:hypothetical protein